MRSDNAPVGAEDSAPSHVPSEVRAPIQTIEDDDGYTVVGIDNLLVASKHYNSTTAQPDTTDPSSTIESYGVKLTSSEDAIYTEIPNKPEDLDYDYCIL